MEDKNELNDIILNKGTAANSNKKIILAVATLGVIFIIVLMLMSSLSSNGSEGQPQAALPPEPQTATIEQEANEPLFEEVEVIEEESNNDANLDQIAQKLKEQSIEENVVETPKTVVVKPTKKKEVKKAVAKKHKAPVKSSTTGSYYIQVGSFSIYEPNKKFLNSIEKLGYSYKYHKVVKGTKTLNKVLVGPFQTSGEAKNARRELRAKVEPGAFLVKL